MSQTIIYVVLGSCGEYSDYREWLVCWRMNEAEAKAIAEACLEEARDFHGATSDSHPHQMKGGKYDYHSDTGTARRAEMIDPWFQTDYTETGYHVAEVSDDPRALAEYMKLRNGKTK